MAITTSEIYRETSSAWLDTTTELDEAGLLPWIEQLDKAVGNQGNHAFATAQGPVVVQEIASVIGGTGGGNLIYYPIIDIYHRRDSDGHLVRNFIPANTSGLTLTNSASSSQAAVVTLNDADGTDLGTPAVVDVDSIPALGAGQTPSNARDRFILFVRARMASGRGMVHFNGMCPTGQLSGTGTFANAATTVVTLPTGYTLPNANYFVNVMQTSGTALFCAITTRAVGSFTITHSSTPAGTETFEWVIIT